MADVQVETVGAEDDLFGAFDGNDNLYFVARFAF